ncbi:MAG: hypothetical protein ACREWE_03580, partial [Gammaproteobacteria bacterium]
GGRGTCAGLPKWFVPRLPSRSSSRSTCGPSASLTNASSASAELRTEVRDWRLHPVVEALQALRGVQFTVAVA